MPSHALADDTSLPDLDDHLVASETRYEMLDGELVYVPPADSPHGTRHQQVGALLEAHVHPAFDIATDMLTRTSQIDDVAPDISVFPDRPDPRSGRHQLAQLVFEIVSTQTLGNAAVKARKLVTRGVRRVFAIDVERSRALEWSAALDDFCMLDPASSLVDPALEAPLPVDTLIGAARTDDAIARALIARDNPVIAAIRKRDREEGKTEGRIEGEASALLVVLAARGLMVDEALRARILGERDHARIERWLARATTCAAAAELLTDD